MGAFVNWIIAGILMIIIEILTPTFFIMWFGIGAFSASVVAYFNLSWVYQILTFLIVSTVLVILTRPIAKRITGPSPRKIAIDEIVGKVGIVLEDVDFEKGGIVKVGSDTWRAVVEKDVRIPKGSKIKVLRVEGTKLVVEPVENHDEGKI